jgi:hypothetical protein
LMYCKNFCKCHMFLHPENNTKLKIKEEKVWIRHVEIILGMERGSNKGEWWRAFNYDILQEFCKCHNIPRVVKQYNKKMFLLLTKISFQNCYASFNSMLTRPWVSWRVLIWTLLGSMATF